MNNMIRPDIVKRDAAGDFIIREIVRIVLYFNKSHQSIVPGIRDVIVGFVDLVSLAAFGYYYGMDGEAEEFSQESFSALMDIWFSGPFSSWPNATIRLVGHDYRAPEYGLRYCGKALDDPGFPDETGLLNLWLPRSFFLENQGEIDSYFRASLTQVPACSGYVNPALTRGDKRAGQALAERYLGLDIADPESVSIDLGIRCPGSYWTTYLGPELASHLGGRQAVRDALGQDSTVEAFPDGGLFIRLAAGPELGDRNRRETLPNNEAFARFLNASGYLHVPRKVVYFEDERGFADPVAQEAWHQRFL